MRRIALIVAIAVLLLSGCGLNIVSGSGNVITETREVSGFDGISLSGTGDLIIVQGDREGLTIETDDNIMNLIDSEVRNGTLHIDLDSNLSFVRPSQTIRYTVYADDLESIRTAGSSAIYAESLRVNDLDVDISGSGDVEIERLEASRLDFTISGSGKANLEGEVDVQTITVSGSGEYNAGDLATEETEITVSGSGDATLWATDRLDVRVSGSGHVRYYGSPQVSQTIAGSGDIESLGQK